MTRDLSDIISGDRVELPAGYRFADPEAISRTELTALDEAVNGPFDSLLDKTDWHCPDYMGARMDVGVISDDGRLVGIGRLLLRDYSSGKISFKRARGDLSHLMVHPDHRSKGVGTAILRERVRIADEVGADLRIDEIMDTNTIHDRYLQLGFEETGAQGELTRGAVSVSA